VARDELRIGGNDVGAFPGHPLTDIQSGSGAVGNAYLFARRKSPSSAAPSWRCPNAWFATNRNAGVVMRKLLASRRSSWAKLPGLSCVTQGLGTQRQQGLTPMPAQILWPQAS